MDSPAYRSIIITLEKDLRKSEVNLVAISEPIMTEAKRIIKHRRLRSPDAIQLATAIHAKVRYQTSLRFLCFDKELNEAAKFEGLQID